MLYLFFIICDRMNMEMISVATSKMEKKNDKKEDNVKKVKKKVVKKDNNKEKIDSVKEVKIEKKKNNNKKKEMYTVREVVVIMIFSLSIGFILCFGAMSLFIGKNYFSVVKDLGKIVDTYYAIVDNYYGDLDKDKLIDGAVEGMISSVGDVFTSYTDADDTTEFDETINGNYEGIGCSVATYTDGKIVVIDVFEDGPADKAGIKINDVVVKVDNMDYKDKGSNDMADYIKNSGKDKVVITILRDKKEIDITVNLGKVEIPYVSGKVIEKEDRKIGYISMSLFSNNSYKQFKNKLEKLEKEGIDSLIIDVRDNNGGYLTSVTDICNLFLEKGKIIYQLEDSHGITKKKDNTKNKRSYEVVVIINGNSASASEILASAIKESYGGYVVGTNSYGKGTVQQTRKLLDGSMIKYTTQKWLTPDGNSINEVGVVPTNYIELSDDYYKKPSFENDDQINEAINILIK